MRLLSPSLSRLFSSWEQVVSYESQDIVDVSVPGNPVRTGTVVSDRYSSGLRHRVVSVQMDDTGLVERFLACYVKPASEVRPLLECGHWAGPAETYNDLRNS